MSVKRFASVRRSGRTATRIRPWQIMSSERGSVLVETALVTPLIVALVVGMFEVTRAVMHYQMVEKGLRAGARYLARVPATSSPTALETWGLDRARCLATRGVAMNSATCDSAGTCIVSEWCGAAARASITVDTSNFLASPPKIKLATDFNFSSPLFSFFGGSSVLRIRVEHEEPFIGR